MSSKRSRVHPPYKTKYRVANWASYNQALLRRGTLGLSISPNAIASWNAKPSERPAAGLSCLLISTLHIATYRQNLKKQGLSDLASVR